MTRGSTLDAWKAEILETLARTGPATVAEIPRAWPRTRQITRGLVDALIREGLVAPCRASGRLEHRVELTEAGRRAAFGADAGGVRAA